MTDIYKTEISDSDTDVKIMRACIDDSILAERVEQMQFDFDLTDREIVEMGLRMLLSEKGYL